MQISFSITWRISVNNLWIADLAIFREWINNHQRATTTPLLVGIESCSLKYFTDTKLVYRKIVELLVFAWTNIVTHLLQEFSFSQDLSAVRIFNLLIGITCLLYFLGNLTVCFIKIGHKIPL